MYVIRLNYMNGRHQFIHGPHPMTRCAFPGLAMRFGTKAAADQYLETNARSIVGEPVVVRQW